MRKYILSTGLGAIALVLLNNGITTNATPVDPTAGLPEMIENESVDINDDGTVISQPTTVRRAPIGEVPDRNRYHAGREFSERHMRAEKWLAGMLFGECRGVGAGCMYAVGHVAMNRAKLDLDSRYGHGLWGVLNKNKQFSCFNKNDPNSKVIQQAFNGQLKVGSMSARKWNQAQNIAHDLMHRATIDPTLGSTHYHTPAIKPKWMHDRGMQRTVRLDGHVFYKWNV